VNPLVSVVMSVYNGDQYVPESVESILNQTFTDFEFIIINDGSTDKTKVILEEYAANDSRILLVHQENLGLTKSLNKGIALARGKYIARQDADDYSLPDRLATEVTFLSSNESIAMVGTAVNVVDGKGNVLAIFRHPSDFDVIKKNLMKHNCFWHGSAMFVRESFEHIGRYRDAFTTSQDYDLWLRFSENYQMANLSVPLYCYRFSPGAVTFKKMVSQYRCGILARRLAEARALNRKEDNTLKASYSFLSSPLTISEKEDIIKNYKPWCRLLLKNNMPNEAKLLMSELFKYHPSYLFKMKFGFAKFFMTPPMLSRFLDHA
jgi:glycosyltransferase involved in cell wall biosynthesis